MDLQSHLVSLVKKKGTGASMSKHLSTDELSQIPQLMTAPNCSLTTKATLLTAIFMLPKNEPEHQWFTQHLTTPPSWLNKALKSIFFPTSTPSPFISLIQRVVSHHDLSQTDCHTAISFLFSKEIPDYQKACFLEAERLKRESDTENRTFFETFWAHSQHHQTPRLLIDLANPYDGFNRNLNLSVFLAPLLASVGIAALCHGLYEVAPKNGITPYKILKLANKFPLQPIQTTVQHINNPDIGWGYVDQSLSFSELHKFTQLRSEMVKRPFIATIEKCLQPISSTNGNKVVIGYTHPPYREKLITMLKHHPAFQDLLILRGQEGSTQLAMDRRSPCIRVKNKTEHHDYIRPQEFHFKESKPVLSNPSAETSLSLGIAGLQNRHPEIKSQLLYQASVILTQFNIFSKSEALSQLTHSIESGKAFTHWQKGMTHP